MSLQPMLERVNSGVEEETVFSTSAISEKEAVSLIGKDCVFSLDFRVGMKTIALKYNGFVKKTFVSSRSSK